MKVWQLKKINSYWLPDVYLNDYEKLLKINDEDIDTIIENIDSGNKSVSTLIKFFLWEQDCLDWEEKFQHLEGIEDANIRKELIVKMIDVNNVDISSEIFNLFNIDFDDIIKYTNNTYQKIDSDTSDISIFKTVDEWRSFIDNIRRVNLNKEKVKKVLIANLDYVLKNTDDNRCQLIEDIMTYSYNSRAVDLTKTTLNDDTLKDNISDIVYLLKKYSLSSVIDLYNYLDSFTQEENLAEFKKKIISFAKYNKIYENLPHNHDYILEFFTSHSLEEINNIFPIFKKIDETNDIELFVLITDSDYDFVGVINDYLIEIMNAEHESDYRNSLIQIYEGNNISYDDNQEIYKKIIEIVQKSQVIDGSSQKLADFICSLDSDYANFINKLIINEENLDTRTFIYDNFIDVISDKFNVNIGEFYGEWLEKLCKLPLDICEKVVKIITLNSFKSLPPCEQEKIMEVILNPENYNSLEYIYELYLEKDSKDYVKKEEQIKNDIHELQQQLTNLQNGKALNEPVKLLTVVELLNKNNDIDKVLDGFKDEEEITPKTLIRSFAYKK